ncbi:hypothetical protein PAXINDRAFT_12314 [Paxillus involutus ATCC 200175]|uniref:Uncharacterized protein n=1 Tax=Paxillus involutus ATCC 200175 TaxID=664439 RepID=A0A0C9TH86_PAXIN|nr:hypothetical protein PAXINDRAFT_12314 [Paxillus involutus ATCC 200175]
MLLGDSSSDPMYQAFYNCHKFVIDIRTASNIAKQNSQGPNFSSTDTNFSNLSLCDKYTSSIPSGSPSNVVEATFYFAGIFCSPPKLVYHMSKDPFIMSKGPEVYHCLKHLYSVYDYNLGNKWEDIRPKVCDLLNKQQVCFLTINIVCFHTVPDQQTPAVISSVVIRVSVLHNSLTGENAFNSANNIFTLLKNEGITAINIKFQESLSAGADLYVP